MAEEKKIATGCIGNALRSSAADHVTTFADEIFDTERQQYQNEINDIVGTYTENPEFLYSCPTNIRCAYFIYYGWCAFRHGDK